MASRSKHEFPNERRSFQITRTSPINPMGTTNTAVVNFGVAAVNKWGGKFAVGTTNVRPTGGSAGWCNVVNNATFGTTMKFNRRGFYEFHVGMVVPLVAEAPPQFGMALILDSSAASMLVATAILPTTLNAQGDAGVIDWFASSQNATVPVGAKLAGIVPITDALAWGAQPEDVAGATGRGVVRLHINNNAGGAFSTAALILSLWCNYCGDCAG